MTRSATPVMKFSTREVRFAPTDDPARGRSGDEQLDELFNAYAADPDPLTPSKELQ